MIKSLKEINLSNKRVLVRCDFNVPLDDSGDIADDFRLRKSLETINYLISARSKVILMSHLGRPKGKEIAALSLNKVGKRLQELIGIPIIQAKDCIGLDVKEQVSNLASRQIILLENLRFHKEEEGDDEAFGKELASLGEVYFNDAFSACHRFNASIVKVPRYLPHHAGFLLMKEIENLDKILKNPRRPLGVLIGGVKARTKEKFINNILKLADWVIIGTAVKKEMVQGNVHFKDDKKIIEPDNSLEELDISDDSIRQFSEKILLAKTLLWNGPFGKFEEKKYEKGTLEIAKAIIKSRAFSVVGGGETIEFLNKKNLTPKFSHVCTGGAAMLSYLAGDELPGIKALE